MPLAAILIAATAAVLPLSRGDAIAPGRLWYQTYLLAVGFAYFGWCWTHGGQTLGMRAWGIRVVAGDGESLLWMQALLRFLSAIASWGVAGFGFLSAVWNRDGKCWHDRLSRTRLIVIR